MTAPGLDGDTWSGAALRAARAASGLTQEQLADKVGIDRVTINKLEKGKRKMTAYYAAQLAPALSISQSELLEPTAHATDPENPLVLLRRLAETVDAQQKNMAALQTRVEALENAAKKTARSSGAAQ